MKNGPYTLVIAPKKYPGRLYRDRYAYEHHVVFWKYKKIIPPKGYEIHHINGNHRDNRISNLRLVSSTEHKILHGLKRSKDAELTVLCGFCSCKILSKKSVVRWRESKNAYRKMFCSRSCGAKHQHKMAVNSANQSNIG